MIDAIGVITVPLVHYPFIAAHLFGARDTIPWGTTDLYHRATKLRRREATVAQNNKQSRHAQSCLSCKERKPGWFCDLPPAALADYDSASFHLTMPAGSILFAEGEAPRGVSILCRGQVKLSKTSSDGRTFLVRVAKPGDVIGLSAALSKTPYEVTAQALHPCQMKTFRRADFIKFVEHHAEGGVKAATSLNKDYRAALVDASRLALAHSVVGRIAHFLLELAVEAGTADDACPVITMPYTHEELASKLGSSRESITRALNGLKRQGVVGIQNDTMTILRKYTLETIL